MSGLWGLWAGVVGGCWVDTFYLLLSPGSFLSKQQLEFAKPCC